MAIRLEDPGASFRRHLRAAAKAPRTIELYGQSAEYVSRWLVTEGELEKAPTDGIEIPSHGHDIDDSWTGVRDRDCPRHRPGSGRIGAAPCIDGAVTVR